MAHEVQDEQAGNYNGGNYGTRVGGGYNVGRRRL
jgi:hypothetical protein